MENNNKKSSRFIVMHTDFVTYFEVEAKVLYRVHLMVSPLTELRTIPRSVVHIQNSLKLNPTRPAIQHVHC